MTTLWAKIVSTALSLVKPLVALFIYWAGKRAAATEIAKEQAEKDSALAEDYLKNRSEERTPDQTLDKIRDGSF
jgi:hypothetical protein